MATRRKALVLGSEMGAFLSVIRSLGRSGIEVDIAWCPADAPAARSRFVNRLHPLPSPAADPAWVDAFADLMAREQFDLVVPTEDPVLIPLQHERAHLERLGRLYLLGDRAFEITSDKVKTRQLALELGIPVAPGQVITDPEQVDAVLSGRVYPLVVKPRATITASDLDQRNWVTRADDEPAARRAIAAGLALGPVLVEDNVVGTGWGVEVLADEGEILLSMQHERVHEPLHGGGSSYRRTVPRDPRFMDAVARLVSALDYTGVAMFEFKGDPDAGRWVLIEINGRFWGSLPLALAAGMDFPHALWQLLVEGRRQFDDDYRTGVYARNLKRDLKWLWLNLHADRRDPVLATVPLPQVAGELAHVIHRREHSDQFMLGDPRPGAIELGRLASRVGDEGRDLLVERTALRRRRQRAAQAALERARRILFVCHGNICRSPFAAALAADVLPPDVEVSSAGTYADSGRRSPTTAREVARELGVVLDDHRSQPVSAELIERADAIFAFDRGNLRALRKRYPAAGAKLHLMGALGPGRLTISDPIDGDADRYRRSFGAIAAALGVERRSHPGSRSDRAAIAAGLEA